MYFKPITDCFPVIKASLSEKDLRILLNEKYTDLNNFHFSIGSWIRNNILRDDSEILNYFNSAGISDKDDMSALIIRLFYIHEKTD